MSEDGTALSTDDRLIYMANQIARNVANEGENAAPFVAQHIRDFWDPHMRARIKAMAAEEGHGLSPIAASAIAQLQ